MNTEPKLKHFRMHEIPYTDTARTACLKRTPKDETTVVPGQTTCLLCRMNLGTLLFGRRK